ncbi:choice-of-anchor J domain-containing protein [Polaribacter batillariae]|uniref:Choice-of-anchor J domain-containing protein n=1 Tax=Polaribacter batillariae TaxID=2808900 RepID=A0ABX7STJ7_9FLAO|nr:DUF5689 domain-containing protein [Polaribacter batillariae]QTD36675.1 choice-of-anchor J domain-containing protein [Polaribacter batillariae]
MKTNKLIILTLAFITSISFTSCVEDGDFTVPQNLGEEENAKLNLLLSDNTIEIKTISQVKALFSSGDNPVEITDKLVVKGYVTSSDKSGNFFKEIYLQDSPENPTDAIKVVLELNDAYNKYNIGREVYINLEGLYVGETRSRDGVTAIGGKADGDSLENLSLNQVKEKMLRSTITEEIVPLKLTLSQINESHVGMFVQIDNVEFPSNIAGEKNYFDENDRFDTKRTLQSCEGFGYSNFELETSSFANFARRTLPKKGGTLKAVVVKTFDGRDVVLALNDITDVDMNEDRCTPLNPADFKTSYEEDFESIASSNPLEGNGWISYAEEGRFNWRVLTTTDNGNPGSKIASMGAYNSGEPTNIAWLISPSIDLDAQDIEFLNFQSSNSFSDDSELELLISTDWDGTRANITSATWTKLSANIVSDDTNFRNWVDSGTTDLSTFSGNAHIAFKYIGGDNSGSASPNTGTIDGTFEIDNFKILVKK